MALNLFSNQQKRGPRTPQDIDEYRRIVAQIMGQSRAPRTIGEGLNALGDGIVANVMGRRADAAQEAGLAEAGGIRQNLIDYMTKGSSFPPAPNPGNTSSMATMPAGESADYIRSGLQQRGLPPHVADAFVLNMQDESGLNPGINERNPIVPGSRGGFGLYQLTGPRRRAYEAFAAQRGVDPSDVDAQLDFLVTELQGPEARAAQSILSAPDTGTAAQAIVNDFLRPAPEHRQSRAARYAAYQGQPQDAGTLGAVNALGAAQPVPVAENEADILAQEQAMAAQDPMAFQQPAPPMSAPQMNVPVNEIPSLMSGSQMQAQAGGFPEMAGRDPSRPPPPDLGMLMQVLSNPFMDEGTKAFAQAQLQQYMQQQDPMRQLQMERAQLENAALRNPQPKETDDIREYNYARQQGYQGSFTDFMTDMRRAGATSVNVGAGEKAWDQESAKLFAKRYDDISAGAMNAQQMMGMYDLAEQALNSGVRTGIGAEAELTLRQMGAAMGMDTDPEKLAGGELIRAVQNRMALTMRSPDGGMGMPGALSDRDIKFLKDSQIGIDRSPEGNRRMLEAFRAMENRKIEIARLADDYIAQNGRLDSGFNQMVREYAQANPLFPEMESGGAPQAGQVVDGYRFKGGDPSDPNSWERQ